VIALEFAPTGAIGIDANLDDIVAGGGVDLVKRCLKIAQ